ASALLMVISSRVSSLSARAAAASYVRSASSMSPARTFASALRRSSSARVNCCSDIPTLTLPTVRLEIVELLRALELDEALDFFLSRRTERFQFVEHRLRPASFFEEVAHAEIKRL